MQMYSFYFSFITLQHVVYLSRCYSSRMYNVNNSSIYIYIYISRWNRVVLVHQCASYLRKPTGWKVVFDILVSSRQPRTLVASGKHDIELKPRRHTASCNSADIQFGTQQIKSALCSTLFYNWMIFELPWMLRLLLKFTCIKLYYTVLLQTWTKRT